MIMCYHWGLGVGHLYTRIPGFNRPTGVALEQLIAEHTGDLGSISETCGLEESALSAGVVGSTLAGEPQQVNTSRNLDSSRQEINCNVSCAGGGHHEGSLGSEDPC
jgi:hypothetical protein